MQGAQVRSLTGELRSRMPCGTAKSCGFFFFLIKISFCKKAKDFSAERVMELLGPGIKRAGTGSDSATAGPYCRNSDCCHGKYVSAMYWQE